MKTIDLCDQKTAPLTPKSFIYNRRSYSQAGRRGFESLLPLHHFNNLHEIGLLQKPTFRGNGVGGCAEPLEKNRLEGFDVQRATLAVTITYKDKVDECAASIRAMKESTERATLGGQVDG